MAASLEQQAIFPSIERCKINIALRTWVRSLIQEVFAVRQEDRAKEESILGGVPLNHQNSGAAGGRYLIDPSIGREQDRSVVLQVAPTLVAKPSLKVTEGPPETSMIINLRAVK